MKVSVETLPTSEAVLDVEVTWDEMQKASDKAYRKLVQKVDVQGFRRGKAPRSLLERKLGGKEYIYQEGLDDLISETYRTTLKEHDLTPISQPKLEAPEFEMGQSYHFSLTVPILTPAEIGDYHALHLEREEASVTSEEVDKELEALRERQSEWKIVERPAAYGDRVTVDLKLTVEDKTISDLHDNPFELTDQRTGLFTGMDEQVVGMEASQSKTFSVTIPTDYSNENMAGKQADYEITVHKVETKELPALDDAFAEKASDGQYQSLEDLSKVLSDNILENKKRTNREELRDKIVDALIEQSTVHIHPVLVQEQAHDMVHQFEHMLEAQHISLDQYLTMTRKSHDEYVEELQPEAEKSIKRQMVLDEIAKKENITVTPEEIEGLFALYSQAGQQLPRTAEQVSALSSSYRREKTLQRLTDIIAGPDPDSEDVDVSEQEEEASLKNAEAAALESETSAVDENERVAEPAATADETKAETVE